MLWPVIYDKVFWTTVITGDDSSTSGLKSKLKMLKSLLIQNVLIP